MGLYEYVPDNAIILGKVDIHTTVSFFAVFSNQLMSMWPWIDFISHKFDKNPCSARIIMYLLKYIGVTFVLHISTI